MTLPASGDVVGFDPTMISTISTSVDNAVDTWTDATIRKQAFAAADPCNGAVFFAEVASNWIGPTVDDATALSAGLANYIHGSVEASLLAKGEQVSGVTGGQSLTEFVLSQVGGQTSRLVPAGFVGALFGAGSLRNYIRDRLPDGSDLLNARENLWSSNSGTQLSSGIYLRGGRYSGTTIRNWIRDWIVLQASQASPAVLPEARSFLGQLVGRWTGSNRVGGWSDIGIWRLSDGASQGSKLGRVSFVLQDSYRIQVELQELCSGGARAAILGENLRAVLPFVAIGAAVFLVLGK